MSTTAHQRPQANVHLQPQTTGSQVPLANHLYQTQQATPAICSHEHQSTQKPTQVEDPKDSPEKATTTLPPSKADTMAGHPENGPQAHSRTYHNHNHGRHSSS